MLLLSALLNVNGIESFHGDAEKNNADTIISMDDMVVSAKYDEDTQSKSQENEEAPPPGHMKPLGEHSAPTVGEITELDYMIGGKDFYEFFLRKRKPVVFRGITSEWMATKQWKNESYLLKEYSNVLFDVETKKIYNHDLHPRKTMDFKEFLASYKNKTLYLDSPFPQSPMMKDLKLPLMMQCEVLHESFTSMHLLYSNGGTSSPLHADGYENFLSVFSGTKVAYVIDPKFGHTLYMSVVKDFPGLSPINPEAVNFIKYPKFYGVPFHKIVLNAGDVLYIPQGWYHQVRSYDSPNIATSMWFQYFTRIYQVDFAYRDHLGQEAEFSKIVEEAPERIECVDQNIHLQSYHELNLNKMALKRKEERHNKTSVLVNKTVLYEEVLLDQPTIYVGSDDKHIYAMDMRTGSVKWKVETAEDTGSTCEFSLDGTLVYCGADDSYMRAITIKNGIVAWAFKTGGAVISSVMVDSNGDLYFGSLDSYMYALYPNGTLKWRKYMQGAMWSSSAQHPVEDFLYISTQSSDIAFNIFALQKSSGKVMWKKFGDGGFTSSPKLSQNGNYVFFVCASSVVYMLDSLHGTVLHKMQLDENATVMASPAVHGNNIVYVLLMSGRLLAVNVVESEIIWERIIGVGKMGASSSPYLGADGALYVGSGNGTVYKLQPLDGSIEWKTNVAAEIFFSSPRLSKDDILFIGSVDGPLHAFNSKTGETIWSTRTNGPLAGTVRITRGFI